MRAEVLLSEILAYLSEQPRIRHPRLAELFAHDAEHGGILVPAVLAYLDAFGGVRAAEISDLSLTDPTERLLTHLPAAGGDERRSGEVSAAPQADEWSRAG